jgi:hypothetical protein
LLDFLKGIAIVAVILYHSGLFTYGYLGVEIFLVVGYLTTTMTKCLFRVGHKQFGICNCVYYNHRSDSDYYHQIFFYDTKLNKEELYIFKDHYIDLMSLIVLENVRYPVFTPDHKLYNHDYPSD